MTSGAYADSYAYDNANNRTKYTHNKVLTSYLYNPLNQLISTTGGLVASYTYDANGNRITRTVNGATDTYAYDYENRLITLVKAGPTAPYTTTGTFTYGYDYRTRRVLRDESTASGNLTSLVFSGGTSVQEIENGTKTVQYVRGSDYGGGIGGIWYTLRNGTPSFTHYNSRGDVIAKTDSSNQVTYQAQYMAFGQRAQELGTTLDRQKANTKDEDPTGLLNEGMRYRDLETGSFITRDPAGMVDGPNEYTYVNENPWTKFDPEGLSTAGDYTMGAVLGYAEGISVEMSHPANPSQAFKSGLTMGHTVALLQGVGETYIGGGMMKTGASGLVLGTTVAVGGTTTGPGEVIAGPTGVTIDIGSAVTLGVGATATAHGLHTMANSSTLLMKDAAGAPESETTPSADGKQPPNPDGSKGNSEHQEANQKLIDEMQAKHPDAEIQSNKSIKEETGVNRRPDAAAVKDGKVLEVGEVARTNKDGTLVKREQIKQAQYKQANIPSTIKTLPPKTTTAPAPPPPPPPPPAPPPVSTS